MAQRMILSGAGTGPRSNLLAIVTLSAAVLVYTGCIQPSYGGDMASKSKATAQQKRDEADKAEARRDRISELSFINALTLGDMRSICAEGQANDIKRKQEARGNGYPEAHEICRAAIDVSAQRGLTGLLFGDLAVRQLGIGSRVQSDSTIAATVNGEPVKVGVAIRDAAAKGATSYIGLSGKAEPLRPELAYDAGHWFGRVRPDAIPTLPPDVQEHAARACYAETPADTITLNGIAVPATKACFIVGGNAGKKFAVSESTPNTLHTPEPVPNSPIKRASTRGSAAGQ